MPNPFCHVELSTTNVPKAQQFYGKLFQWTLRALPLPTPAGPYTAIDVGAGTGGGMMRQMIPGAGSAWMPYVLVDDIKVATRRAKRLGGRVMKDVSEVEGMGWLSILMDPTGAMFGLWQPLPPAAAKRPRKSGARPRRR